MEIKNCGGFVRVTLDLEFGHSEWKRILEGAAARGVSAGVYVAHGASMLSCNDEAAWERRRARGKEAA